MVLSGHNVKVNARFCIVSNRFMNRFVTFQITSATINFKKLGRPKLIRIGAAAAYINIMSTNPWRLKLWINSRSVRAL